MEQEISKERHNPDDINMLGRDGDLSNWLTILSSTTKQKLSKVFSGQSLLEHRFFHNQFFHVDYVEVSCLRSLASTIKGLEGESHRVVVRGSLAAGMKGPTARKKEYFKSAFRSWCMIDIDGLYWDGPLDHEQMLRFAVEQLPAEFHGVDCWYQFSSSMGIKEGIRVHLWYWLERPCSDAEMKAWLSGSPADLRMFNPIQLHLTAPPQFLNGAVDPILQRSGLLAFGMGKQSVPVPDDLIDLTTISDRISKPRQSSTAGTLDTNEIIRDEQTGLAIDGREALMFLLSNQVMRDLVTSQSQPSEDEVTEELWKRFCIEADVSMVSDRGLWTVEDARVKAKARLQELADGTFDFVSRSDKTTLVPHQSNEQRPNLVSAEIAKSQLNDVMTGFFDHLSKGQRPRFAVRITMGTGKTTETINHLKA